MFKALLLSAFALQPAEITVNFESTRQRGEVTECFLFIGNQPLGLVSRVNGGSDTISLETRYVVRGERSSLGELEFSYVLSGEDVRFEASCEDTVCTTNVGVDEFLEVISAANEGGSFSLGATPLGADTDVVVSTDLSDRIDIDQLSSCIDQVAR